MALLVSSTAAAQAPHPTLSLGQAQLSALYTADDLDNRLAEGGYLTDRPGPSDHNFAVFAYIHRPRRESPYRWRVRVYFYDGDTARDRFVGLAKVVIRIDERGHVSTAYHWLKGPRRPPQESGDPADISRAPGSGAASSQAQSYGPSFVPADGLRDADTAFV